MELCFSLIINQYQYQPKNQLGEQVIRNYSHMVQASLFTNQRINNTRTTLGKLSDDTCFLNKRTSLGDGSLTIIWHKKLYKTSAWGVLY